MSKLPKTPNPFTQENWFNEFLEQDLNLEEKARNNFYKLKTRLEPKYSPWFKFKNNFLNISSYLATNTFFIGFIGFISLTTVSATTAEVVAPIQYKPSKLLDIFIKQKTNYRKSVTDKDNYIVNFNNCDLFIRFPKTKNGVSLDVFDIYRNDTLKLPLYHVAVSNTNQNSGVKTQDFTAGCLEKNKNTSSRDIVLVYATRANKIIKKELTQKELQQQTNWDLAKANIQNINSYILESPSKSNQHLIIFEFENKIYWNTYYQDSQDILTIRPQDLNLSFGSLAKNKEANKDDHKAEDIQIDLSTKKIDSKDTQKIEEVEEIKEIETLIAKTVLENKTKSTGSSEPKEDLNKVAEKIVEEEKQQLVKLEALEATIQEVLPEEKPKIIGTIEEVEDQIIEVDIPKDIGIPEAIEKDLDTEADKENLDDQKITVPSAVETNQQEILEENLEENLNTSPKQDPEPEVNKKTTEESEIKTQSSEIEKFPDTDKILDTTLKTVSKAKKD